MEPANWAEANQDLANELKAFARENVGPIKAPKQVDFVQALPREPTGKLYKRLVRDAYWTKHKAAADAAPAG